MRARVQSLALLNGLGIWHCSVGCRHDLDLLKLWLWYGPAAAALIQPLAWEPSCAAGTALKKKKKKFFFHSRVREEILFIFFK